MIQPECVNKCGRRTDTGAKCRECEKKYSTIVIDPPWPIETGYNSKTLHSPMTKIPYKTMSLKEIEEFPIGDYTQENCNLFIWTIQLYLPFTFELIKKWGFKYHCLMTWDKVDGINCWGFTRNSEFVIYCYKGKLNLNLQNKFIPTSFKEKRTTHSKKPQIFYEYVRRISPDPRIDIFSRKPHFGFDSFGDQSETPETLETFF